MATADSRVWLITGTSTGFGRVLAEQVLKKGDSLIATARNPQQIETLVADYSDRTLAVQLDVTHEEQIKAAVEQAVATFGHIDVLVNNAGYGLIGALEEVSNEQIRRNFETNLFGAIDMMRAVLPVMRQQRSGHIINMSAIAGFTNELGFSIYGGAKFAIEGISEALQGEVAPFGIKVTLVEPGPFRTDFIGRSLDRATHQMAEYQPTVGKFLQFLNTIEGKQPGDPVKAAKAIIQIVESENPPLRLVLGHYAYSKFRQKIESLTQELDAWEDIAANTDFVDTPVVH
ncbi:oxidoreductase [Pseudanabaena sp. FACHB-2040]|uniref:oxidoreductase n=1 Tax=Pseudanabaena sp. FACHB-2040 TaxID=2692859 RepID=UPI001689F211|nr:oxidoreductase [Pseudanabaena sp. FACHB-2040]MBD2257983.1 SDR family NAD(P)-dependent oxidoreductase [Pseudanabaena sp. FACHB-2040]